MKAATAESLSDINLPSLVSPKLDGIRAICRDGVLYSRQMKRIPNTHIQSFAHLIPPGFEGELVAVDGEGEILDFSESTSLVMSIQNTGPFRFFIFDICDHRAEFQSFGHRAHIIREELVKQDLSWIQAMPQMMCTTEDQLRDYYDRWSAKFEGIICRNPDGHYKRGRSTLKKQEVVKLKPMKDAEARVIGFEEEMGDNRTVHKGTLGALRCVFQDAEFRVGTGFSASDRRMLWEVRDELIGLRITFKYQQIGAKGAPRFPVFKAFRED